MFLKTIFLKTFAITGFTVVFSHSHVFFLRACVRHDVSLIMKNLSLPLFFRKIAFRRRSKVPSNSAWKNIVLLLFGFRAWPRKIS